MRPLRFLSEFWILLGLTITSLISLTLLALHLSHWQGSERLAAAIISNNTLTTVIVQIISHVHGMILVQSLCALVKIHFRSSTISKPVSLEYARFLNALSTPRPLRSQRFSFTTLTILFTMLSAVPGAVWSGAISPNMTNRQVLAEVQIPSYPVNNLSAVFDSAAVQNSNGSFTFDPSEITSQLLVSAQEASNRNATDPSQTPHRKLDNTGYIYIQRSFGAGSLVGLEDVSVSSDPLSYEYNETGIVANAACQRNDSATFQIVYNASSQSPGGLLATTGYTVGEFPNGLKVSPAWLFGATFSDLFAVDQVYVQNARQAYVVITSATQDESLNLKVYRNLQCNITFTSHTIGLRVDTTNKTIATTVLEETHWPVYGDNITSRAMVALRRMTDTDNGWAGSRLGRAMSLNSQTLRYLETGNYSSSEIPDTVLIQSVSDFVVSIFENMLVFIGACRLECAKSSQLTPAVLEVRSVVFGAPRFIYTIVGLNFVLILAVLYIVVFRKAWLRTVDLDFTDVADVALNASRGGTGLFRQLEAKSASIDAQFTVDDVRSRWPTIIAARSVSSGGDSILLQNTTHRADRRLAASSSKSRLLSPDQQSLYERRLSGDAVHGH